ncbi:MAG: class I adenylate-forming enzyme family protein [Eubacteriales bacterium]|nr:class I adenylate-forming enzyme family protein [Eubacteriales bacterium]
MKGFMKDRLEELNRLYPVWEKKTIWDFFEATGKRFPNRVFIGMENRENVTYRETAERALYAAEGLSAMGVRPGDHVAVQMDNSVEQITLFLALSALGAVKIPVNPALSAGELEYVLNQSESRFCLREPVYGDKPFHPEKGDSGSISDIIYTSGSTNAPKGVMLTHDMLMRSAWSSCLNRGFESGRKILVPIPLFHVYGYVEGLLTAILTGGAVYLRGGKFTAEPVARYIKESGVNDILSVPAQMMALIRFLKDNPEKFPELHSVYCSASVCPAWVWPGIRSVFGVEDVITGYGMTEVSGASMQTAPGDGDEILNTRAGRLLPGGAGGLPELGGRQIQYRVVDRDTGTDCPAGRAGELWCRGPVVTCGYYNRPEENRRAFTEDGWFKTGDCGWFDEAGYLAMEGRLDDMYKINGENVSPKFLEDVLGGCPQIHSVEVVGTPDEKHGQVGAAFIQLKSDSAENRLAAEAYARERLAKFQVPKYFIYMKAEDWPRTSTGKVQKFRLKELAAEAAEEKKNKEEIQ